MSLISEKHYENPNRQIPPGQQNGDTHMDNGSEKRNRGDEEIQEEFSARLGSGGDVESALVDTLARLEDVLRHTLPPALRSRIEATVKRARGLM